jgi:hypothetical protein
VTPTLYQGQAEPTDAMLDAAERVWRWHSCGNCAHTWQTGMRAEEAAAVYKAMSLAASSAAPTDLHAAIMNLPCVSPYPQGTGWEHEMSDPKPACPHCLDSGWKPNRDANGERVWLPLLNDALVCPCGALARKIAAEALATGASQHE